MYANNYSVQVKTELVDSELMGGEPFQLLTKVDPDGGGSVTGEACAVCGEEAGGVYFGATVCLPCKSFYIRCTKDTEDPDLKCQQKSALCSPPDGRIKCQYCRFMKCRSAGMMRRKEKPEVVTAPEGKTNCVVCGDIANGIHFGVMTCEGCKKFFRRSQNEAHSYMCKDMKMCAINPRTRNNCRACRYQKCIDVGMSRDAIKVGRPPNKDVRKKAKPYATPQGPDKRPHPPGYRAHDESSNSDSISLQGGDNLSLSTGSSGYSLPTLDGSGGALLPQLNVNPDDDWNDFFGIFGQGSNSLLPINPEDIDVLINDNVFNVSSAPAPYSDAGLGGSLTPPDAVVPEGLSPGGDLTDFGLCFPGSPASDLGMTGQQHAAHLQKSDLLRVSGHGGVLGGFAATGAGTQQYPPSPQSVSSSGYATATERSPLSLPIGDDSEMPMDLNALETPDAVMAGGVGVAGGAPVARPHEAFFVEPSQMPIEFDEQTEYVADVWSSITTDHHVQSGAGGGGGSGSSAPAKASNTPAPATTKDGGKRKPRPPMRIVPGSGLPSHTSKSGPVQKKPSPPPTAPPPKKPSPSPPAPSALATPTPKANHVSVIKKAKSRSIKKNDVVPLLRSTAGSRGRAGSGASAAAMSGETANAYSAAAWRDMYAVLNRSVSVDYWAKYRAPGQAARLSAASREHIRSFNAVWARAVAMFGKGKEAVKVNTWSKHTFPSEDAQVTNWIQMTEGIMNGTAALVLLLSAVPGVSNMPKGLKRLLISRSVFSCAMIMNVTTYYSRNERKFLHFWNWEVKESDPLYEFQSKLLTYAEMLSQMELDQTEALLLCILITLASDYHDVQGTNVEVLRNKILHLLFAYMNDKQANGSKERLEEVIHFVPYLRHVAFWHDRMMEQLHSVTGVSSKMQRLSISGPGQGQE